MLYLKTLPVLKLPGEPLECLNFYFMGDFTDSREFTALEVKPLNSSHWSSYHDTKR